MAARRFKFEKVETIHFDDTLLWLKDGFESHLIGNTRWSIKQIANKFGKIFNEKKKELLLSNIDDHDLTMLFFRCYAYVKNYLMAQNYMDIDTENELHRAVCLNCGY